MTWFTEGRHSFAFTREIAVDEIARRFFRNDDGVRARLTAFAVSHGLVIV
jgi:hypothetical protein